MTSITKIFPHLKVPQAEAGLHFKGDSPKRAGVNPARQKVYRLILNSADAEMGPVNDMWFHIETAPWLMEDNIDLGDKHWELRVESFIWRATKGTAAAPLDLEVHLDGWPLQVESYHSTLKGASDVCAVLSGTDMYITDSQTDGIGGISLTRAPPAGRLHVRLSQIGAPGQTFPALANLTNPYWYMTIAIVPTQV